MTIQWYHPPCDSRAETLDNIERWINCRRCSARSSWMVPSGLLPGYTFRGSHKEFRLSLLVVLNEHGLDTSYLYTDLPPRPNFEETAKRFYEVCRK